MTNQKLPTYDELLRPDGPVCLVITATLKPVGGTDRFQPAGFPEVGHVIYDAPRTDSAGRPAKEKVCIVDSPASMANHLETVCLADSGSLDLHEDLTGLPYVVCETDGDVKIANGEVKCDKKKKTAIASTFTEGHRIASDYFLDGRFPGDTETTFRNHLRSEFKIVEVKADKTYFIPPETWWSIFRTLFKFDPNSLVHGVLFAKEQIKISRMLTAHMEAFGASRVGSAGVKFDRLQKTTSGQPIFSVDEETAERIEATFVLDLGLLRSFGRGKNGLNDAQKLLLLKLALWKIGQLVLRPFRYRSQCFLKYSELSATADGDSLQETKEGIAAWLNGIGIKDAIKNCEFGEKAPTKVYYPATELYKAGKENDSTDSHDDLNNDRDDEPDPEE